MQTGNIRSNPHIITAMIYPADPDAPPPPRVPSSRTIARMQEKAEAEARNAAAAQVLTRQVQPGLRPPPGQLFATDAAGLVLCGPAGGIGTTERMVRTLTPLVAGGRHLPAVLMASGGWQDEGALREALTGIGPKLAVLGLRICGRKTGLRIGKLKAA
ncbi:hypothetical protein [Methylobacterium sp. GC_Met_2]|uniref:hypothetical protein n=1 Tax=Methylobacterium sp. GC_Met_2 TaxID=2937376 RepID=UPI00226B37EC|nr:hypothetical protein [Methylobacterium sp. GC_Met_2]